MGVETAFCFELGIGPDEVGDLRIRCTPSMAFEFSAILSIGLLALAAALFVMGGLRFRRWAVENRVGVPGYSTNTETIMLWLIYSVGISIVIVVALQTFRHF